MASAKDKVWAGIVLKKGSADKSALGYQRCPQIFYVSLGAAWLFCQAADSVYEKLGCISAFCAD
ncbi:MAG: hypothetical protein J1D88_02130 [Treponema sp.]|nr:hypothetical protein [Treponema sp.]